MPKMNAKNKIDAKKLVDWLEPERAACAFFDPQYRAILDKMNYGNEGERQKKRAELPQMSEETITYVANGLANALRPMGHLFMWIDKFMLVQSTWPVIDGIHPVDLFTWQKPRIGMGYRSRRKSEYLLVFQKEPLRAKGVWTDRGIPDVWTEDAGKDHDHPHLKPRELQKRLIESVTKPGDLVLDPCAGSYRILDICKETKRKFMGGDILG